MNLKPSALASLLIALSAQANGPEEYRVQRNSPQADGVEEPTLLTIDVNGKRILVTREILNELIDYEIGEHVELDGNIVVHVYDRIDEVVVINNDRVILSTSVRNLTHSAHNSRGFIIKE